MEDMHISSSLIYYSLQLRASMEKVRTWLRKDKKIKKTTAKKWPWIRKYRPQTAQFRTNRKSQQQTKRRRSPLLEDWRKDSSSEMQFHLSYKYIVRWFLGTLNWVRNLLGYIFLIVKTLQNKNVAKYHLCCFLVEICARTMPIYLPKSFRRSFALGPKRHRLIRGSQGIISTKICSQTFSRLS